MFIYRAMSLLAILCVTLSACVPANKTWRDGNYMFAYLNRDQGEISIRFKKAGETWQDEDSVRPQGSGQFVGVDVATEDRGLTSVLGYTMGDELRIHHGLGTAFDFNDNANLSGVASTPSIVHTENNKWLVGFTRSQGTGIEVRTYPGQNNRDLGDSVSLAGIQRNNFVGAGPALAYFNGRLVLVWGRVADNRTYRYAAGSFDHATSTFTLDAQGDIPLPPGGGVSEFTGSPSLTHDGVGTFYLAAVYRGSTSGLSNDSVFVYMSADGTNWSRMTTPFPDGSSFLAGQANGQTNVSIAAQPNGELMLSVVSGLDVPGQTFRFNGGAWNDLGSIAFGSPPASVRNLSMTRRSVLE